MKTFPGFPSKMSYSALPGLFFTYLLPQINDLAELKVSLHLLQSLVQRRGYPKYITLTEILNNEAIVKSLGSAEALRCGLEKAISRGTFLHLSVERGGKVEELYLLNTEADRRALAKIESGEFGNLPLRAERLAPNMSDIFTLYEENIGLITPLIAEELKEAEGLYPSSWIEDAFKEAVTLNRRSWRYITRILERWAQEGKDHGKSKRYSKKVDQDKYIRGKYGHIVQR